MTDPVETNRVTVSTTPPAAPQRRSAGSVLTALGLVLLALAIGLVWTQTQDVARGVTQLDITTHRLLDGVEKSNAAARDRLAARLDGLEQRLRKIEQDVAAAPTLAPALTPAPAVVPVSNADNAGLQQRIAAVEARLSIADLAQMAARALAAGKPLGAIPGAPPALARYADSKPPTEAGLRQEFGLLSARAAEASKPATEADGVAQRMWLHVQSLVTVRDHDRVLVGAPAAIVLGDAQDRLTAGDLAGAVAVLAALDPAAASIMADWAARAQALLDARAALAALPGAR